MKKKNTCGYCNQSVKSRIELNNHILNLHSPVNRNFACLCGATFLHEEQLTFHRYHQCQDERVIPPPLQQRDRKKKAKRAKRQNHITAFSRHLISDFVWTYRNKDGTAPPPDTDPHEPIEEEDEEEEEGEVVNNVDPLTMGPRAEAEISAAVQAGLFEHGNLKVHMTGLVRFQRETPEGIVEIPFHTASRSFIVHNMQVFRGHYEAEVSRMVNHIHDFTENGSGWRLHQVVGIQYDLARYAPFGGGNFLPTPPSITKKKAIVNPYNLEDERCLVYAIALALFENENPGVRRPQSVTSIPARYIEQVPVQGLHPPYFVEELSILEQRNPRLALNCFSMHVEDKARDIVPIRISNFNYQPEKIMVNLLLLYDGNGRYHYTWVKNISRLLVRTKRNDGGLICVNCQHIIYGLARHQRFREHVQQCKTRVTGRLEFGRGPIRFDRVATQQKKGFVIYADFESCLSPQQPDDKDAEPPPPKKRRIRLQQNISHRTWDFEKLMRDFAFPNFSVPEQQQQQQQQQEKMEFEHKPPAGHVLNQHHVLSYTLVLITPKLKHNKVFFYSDTGENKVKSEFVDDLYYCKHIIEQYYADRVESAVSMHELTPQQKAEWEAATECYVCKQPFLSFETAGVSKKKFWHLKQTGKLQWRKPHEEETFIPLALLRGCKVRDHDHDTG